MVRLVKGAYWDSEIKRAQVDGLEGFPVFTRKLHTDVCYLACARRLLAAPDAVFPQFATHNAQTLAAVLAMAGRGRSIPASYEFQCLHGMGEPLYEEVVGPGQARPALPHLRAGRHARDAAGLSGAAAAGERRELVLRATASAMLRSALDELIADPVAQVARHVAARRAASAHRPAARPVRRRAGEFGRHRSGRTSSALASLARGAAGRRGAAVGRRRRCSADGVVGGRRRARCAILPTAATWSGRWSRRPPAQVDAALGHAVAAAPVWQATPPADRAACLRRAADLMEARMPALIGLIVREAGKTLPNAVGEVREAVDFLRYYAAQVADSFDNDTHRPLGPVACISPWNFPLAIFTGQVAAALAAGNAVLAKPAEETPLIAAAGRRASCTRPACRRARCNCCPATARSAPRLVADARVRGVMFTGSTEVARLIRRTLADRLSPGGRPIPLIAETGGQNAMVVDSLGAARAGGRRRARLRLRFRRPALLGAARAVPAGGGGRPGDGHAEGRDGRAVGRQSRPALHRCRPGDHRRRARRHPRRISKPCGRAGRAVACRPAAGGLRARQLRRADADRDRRHRRTGARGVRAGAARGALAPRGVGRAARRHQRDRLRADLRRAHPHRRDDRARHRRASPPATATSTAT